MSHKNTTVLVSPPTLHYPITIISLKVSVDTEISRHCPLFLYEYSAKFDEPQESGLSIKVQRDFVENYESPIDGVLICWKIKEGEVIKEAGQAMLEVQENCTHAVQYGGLCGICGQSVVIHDYLIDQRSNVSIDHNTRMLTVSSEEASRLERESILRLVRERRLSLIVDLDQTVIHATVDPTVAVWMADPSNLNHDALSDVAHFQLSEGSPGSRKVTTYYIKKRPGLDQFLESISSLFELHIYTMGTKAYAINVTNVIDPTRKYFGDRILSRDESGSLVQKSIERLFPYDSTMVVIIDDRADVWSWSPNLIKVRPFEFFVGIGDINAGFNPNNNNKYLSVWKDSNISFNTRPNSEKSSITDRLDLNMIESSGDESEIAVPVDDDQIDKDHGKINDEEEDEEDSDDEKLDPEGLEVLDDSISSTSLAFQEKKHLEMIESQQLSRPLEKQQIYLENQPDESLKHKPVLQNNDSELYYLEKALRSVHESFYSALENQQLSHQQKRPRMNSITQDDSNTRNSQQERLDLQKVDVAFVIRDIRVRTLSNVVLCFSGIIPLGQRVETSDIALWAQTFGASISVTMDYNVTHLIASQNQTVKVCEALRLKTVKIVSLSWLLDSISQWQLLDEEPYKLFENPNLPGSPQIYEYQNDAENNDPHDNIVLNDMSILQDAEREVDAALAELDSDDASSEYVDETAELAALIEEQFKATT